MFITSFLSILYLCKTADLPLVDAKAFKKQTSLDQDESLSPIPTFHLQTKPIFSNPNILKEASTITKIINSTRYTVVDGDDECAESSPSPTRVQTVTVTETVKVMLPAKKQKVTITATCTETITVTATATATVTKNGSIIPSSS